MEFFLPPVSAGVLCNWSPRFGTTPVPHKGRDDVTTYMKILSRFIAQGNIPRVLEKLAEIEELFEGVIPWMDMISFPSRESLAVLASRYGQVAVLKVLQIKHAPILYFETGNLDTKKPIHEAVENGNMDCLEYLVESIGVSVNSLKRADWTPLMLACTKPNVEIVQYLLDHGADFRFTNKDGWNAFHIACREGNLEIVKLLFRTDPGVAQTISRNGRTPLHTAALHGRTVVVQFLLQECHIDPNLFDASGRSPIDDAKVSGHQELARLLEGH